MQVRVHSVAKEKVEVTATLPGGQEVQALVDGLTIELVALDESTTFTRRFVPEDMEAAEALYVQDAHLVVSFEPAE